MNKQTSSKKTKTAKITIDNQTYTLPIYKATEGSDVIDITKLYAKSNHFTYDPGFTSTASCQSNITFIDGENGILRYRGYDIEELANNSSFIEVSYLLIFGEMPSSIEIKKFEKDIKKECLVHEDITSILKSFPHGAHPMGVLASLTSALISFNPGSVDVNSEEKMYQAIVQLIAKFSVITAWVHRKVKGLPLNYSDNSLPYVENLAQMMFSKPNEQYQNNPVISSALNKLLILHADHEQNCSTSTVRIVGSSEAGWRSKSSSY